MGKKALICGGSIGGLFAATALLARGWEVEVFERVGVELSGRGAGIVTHPELIAAIEAVGASTADLGVAVSDRVTFDLSGAEVARRRYVQIVTSWDRIHQLLRGLIPDGRYHLGKVATGYATSPDAAEVRFADGTTAQGDVLIGADGFRSAMRGQMHPTVQPTYAGYVVWRALAQERDLPAAVHRDIFGTFGLYLPTGTQIIGYPIAGPGNDLRPGHRRYNFVWYVPTSEAVLDDMLTDRQGQRHALSIPPPMVRDEVVAAAEALAARILPPQFVAVLEHSERPFFTPIYDHLAPRFHDGRVALSGDAACVARPHVGMGVTKAAADALELARLLDLAPVEEALAAYTRRRVPAARAAYKRAQLLGSYMLRAPDGVPNPDGRGNPMLDFIMEKTAVADF